MRQTIYGFWFICLTTCFSIGLADENLLDNPEFRVVREVPMECSSWNFVGDWAKDTIPAFQGMPQTLNVVRTEKFGIVYQDNIACETNTWYTLSAWYRGKLKPVSAYSRNFWLHLGYQPDAAEKLENDKKGWLCTRLPGAMLGSISAWRHIKTYINPGDRTNVRLELRIFGEGEALIGNCCLEKFKDGDGDGPFIYDPDFEDGFAGMASFDFSGAIITQEFKPPSGKQALLIAFKRDTGFRCELANVIPAKPDAEVVFTMYAKSVNAGQDLQLELSRHGKHFRNAKTVRLDDVWRKYRFSTLVPSAGDLFEPGLQTFILTMTGPAGDADNTVLIDKVDLQVIPRETEKWPAFGTETNPVKNSSFEQGLNGWNANYATEIANNLPPFKKGGAEIDTATAAEGDCSIKMTVPDTCSGNPSNAIYGRGTRIYSTLFPAIADEVYTVSFWGKATAKAPIAVMLTLSGYPQYGGRDKIVLTEQWQRYETAITPKKTDHGYVNLLFYAGWPGTYWIDGIQVEKGTKATAYQPAGNFEVGLDPDRLYPWYKKGDQPKMKVFLCSRLTEKQACEIEYQTRNWKGDLVNQAAKRVKLPAGKTIIAEESLFAKEYGPFVVEAMLRDPTTGERATSDMIYGVFPEVRDVPPEKSWFGMHCGWSPNMPPVLLPGGDLGDYFKLLRLIGCRWERSFAIGAWRLHEPQLGKPFLPWEKYTETERKAFRNPENRGAFRHLDYYVDKAKTNGIELLAVLGYSATVFPQWALSDRKVNQHYSDKIYYYPELKYWTEFVGKMAKHYGDRIKYFEILNETGFFEDKEYVEYSKEAYATIKNIDPAIQIVAPAAWPPDEIPKGEDDNGWTGRVLKMGLYNYLDVYSGHFYPRNGSGNPYGSDPDLVESYITPQGTMEERLRLMVAFLRKAYGDKPIWDTESGQLGGSQLKRLIFPEWFYFTKSVSPAEQARRFVRLTVMKMAAGIKRHFWHLLAPNRAGVYIHELVEDNFAPMPVTVAYAQMARRLDNFTFVTNFSLGRATLAYIFSVDNNSVAVYWNYETKDKDGNLAVPVSAKAVMAEDMLGNQIEPVAKSGSIILPLGESPVYLVSEKFAPEELAGILRRSLPAGINPAELRMGLGALEADGQTVPAVAIKAENIVGEPITNLTMELTCSNDKWRFAKSDVRFAAIPSLQSATNLLPLTRIGAGECLLSAQGACKGYRLKCEAKVVLQAVSEPKPEISVDGNICENEYPAPPIFLGADKQFVSGKTEGGNKDWSQVFISWKVDCLYFGIKVKDDIIVNQDKLELLYQQDSLEIYLNTDPLQDIGDPRYNIYRGRFVIAPPMAPGEPPRMVFQKTPGGKLKNVDAQHAKLACKKTAEGYNLEFSIPLENCKLKKGQVWGLYLAFHDYDGAKRDVYSWMGRDGYFKDANQWGYMLFE